MKNHHGYRVMETLCFERSTTVKKKLKKMYKYEYKRVDLQNCFQSAQQVKLERDYNRTGKSTVDLTWHLKNI